MPTSPTVLKQILQTNATESIVKRMGRVIRPMFIGNHKGQEATAKDHSITFNYGRHNQALYIVSSNVRTTPIPKFRLNGVHFCHTISLKFIRLTHHISTSPDVASVNEPR